MKESVRWPRWICEHVEVWSRRDPAEILVVAEGTKASISPIQRFQKLGVVFIGLYTELENMLLYYMLKI